MIENVRLRFLVFLVFKFQALFKSKKYFQVSGNVFDPLTTVSIRTRIFMDAQMIQILK